MERDRSSKTHPQTLFNLASLSGTRVHASSVRNMLHDSVHGPIVHQEYIRFWCGFCGGPVGSMKAPGILSGYSGKTLDGPVQVARR